MASDEEIRRMIHEIEKLKRKMTNLKSKVRRRLKKLEKTFSPLEKGQIEFEIEILKGKIRRLQILEITLSLPLIKAIADDRKTEHKVDWSKAGRA